MGKKLKDIEGLLQGLQYPYKGDEDYGYKQAIEDVGEKELEIDIDKVYTVLYDWLDENNKYIPEIVNAIAKSFPVKVKL